MGILTSAENAILASDNFENLAAEQDNFQKSLTDVINILEGKRARFIAGDSESSQKTENEAEPTESEEKLTFQIESLKFLKDNSIVIIQDRSKKIQSMTQLKIYTTRFVIFNELERAISPQHFQEGTAKR